MSYHPVVPPAAPPPRRPAAPPPRRPTAYPRTLHALPTPSALLSHPVLPPLQAQAWVQSKTSLRGLQDPNLPVDVVLAARELPIQTGAAPVAIDWSRQPFGVQSSFHNFQDMMEDLRDYGDNLQEGMPQLPGTEHVVGQLSPRPVVSSGPSRRPPITNDKAIPTVSTDECQSDDFVDAKLAPPSLAEGLDPDMASAIETWKANEAADGVADESLDISQASSIGTVVAGDSGPASSLTAPASRAPPLAATPSSG